AAIGGGYDLDGVGIRNVLGRAEDFEGGHVDAWLCERSEQCCDMFGAEERLVALDIDVDFGVDELGNGVNSIRSAGQIGRGHFAGNIKLAAKGGDLFGVCGDNGGVELGTGP